MSHATTTLPPLRATLSPATEIPPHSESSNPATNGAPPAGEDTLVRVPSNTSPTTPSLNGTLPAPLTPPHNTAGALPSQPHNAPLSTSAAPEASEAEDGNSGSVRTSTEGRAGAIYPDSSTPLRPGKQTNHWNLKADKKAWTTTYWPYSSSPEHTDGDPRRNLWAKDGCLDKLDQLLKNRGLPTGARDHELVSALNFLKNDGTPSGYYVPSRLIEEYDAERTTGVDFTGNGRLDPDVRIDFLDDNAMFGQNGRTTGMLDVSWWGSCDKVALAGILFEAPLENVTLNGVTFTRRDLKGLLTLIAESQAPQSEYTGTRFLGTPDWVLLKDGTAHVGQAINVSMEDCLSGEFERFNGNQVRVKRLAMKGTTIRFRTPESGIVTFPADEVVSLEREDIEEPSASDFHQTVKRWLREGRPFAMDREPGEHVWNVGVDEAEIRKSRKSPFTWAIPGAVGFNGPRGTGDICYYRTALKADGVEKETYDYWIEKRDGEHINSGWIQSDNPGFLWRPTVSEAAFEGDNERNPFVNPALVKELYFKAISNATYRDQISAWAWWARDLFISASSILG